MDKSKNGVFGLTNEKMVSSLGNLVSKLEIGEKFKVVGSKLSTNKNVLCNNNPNLKEIPAYNEKIIIDNDKKYNSAGVLIVNRFANKDCVVFFKSSRPVPSGINKGKFYCDIPGGGIDIEDGSLEETASRELFEVSKKLLSISKNNLAHMKESGSFLELPGRRLSGKRKIGLFACYICKLAYVNVKIYNSNKDILKKMSLDSVYYETIELIRFPIDEIRAYFKNKKLSDIKNQCEIRDSSGTLQFITLLASKCLFLAVSGELPLIDSAVKLIEYEEVENNLDDGKHKGKTIRYGNIVKK